jgi:hypothetical protein
VEPCFEWVPDDPREPLGPGTARTRIGDRESKVWNVWHASYESAWAGGELMKACYWSGMYECAGVMRRAAAEAAADLANRRAVPRGDDGQRMLEEALSRSGIKAIADRADEILSSAPSPGPDRPGGGDGTTH